jgi:O-antigen/teichoic acid export membrane protein
VMHLLFGHRYGAGSGALRTLSVTALVAAPAWLAAMVAARLARVRDRLLAASLSIEAGVIAIYLLATADGIVGAAVGVDVLVTLYALFHFWVVASMIDLELRALLRTVIRTALAAAAAAAVLYGLGTGDLSVASWVVGAVGGVAVYVAALRVTGEISVGALWSSRISERAGRSDE